MGRPSLIDKVTNDETRDREAYYRFLFEQMEEAFIYSSILQHKDTIGSEYIIEEVNPTFTKLFGFQRNDVIKQDLVELLTTIFGDANRWNALLAKITSESEHIIEEGYSEAIGRWLNVSLFSPQKRGIMLLITDITNRKIIESTLKQQRDVLRQQVKVQSDKIIETEVLIDLVGKTITDGIIVLDPKGQVRYANNAFSQLYEDIFKRQLTLGEYLLSDEDHSFYAAIKKILNSTESETINIEPIPGLYIRLSDLKNPRGDIDSIGTVIEARDITQFMEYDILRQQFVSTVSHELRTPISVIVQSLENIREYGDKVPEATKQLLLDSVWRNSLLMSELIEDLLLVSRLEAQRVQLQYEKMRLTDVLDQVLYQLGPKQKSKHLSIDLQVSEKTILWGDKKRIGQILRIFLDNAIKYSDADGLVTISAQKASMNKYNPDNQSGQIIQIVDSGIGIPKSEIPHLFTHFFRANNVGERQGTGLGLSIAQKLIQLHNGSIYCESKENEGTTFTLFLPDRS